MGILGYPNMDDNNHDGIFGDYSEIYSNYSTDDNTQPVAEQDAEQVQEENNSGIPQVAPQAERQSNNRLLVYLLILGVLLVSAVGMFVYKKQAESVASQEQSLGDYFYEQTNTTVAQQTPAEPMATIDVDLNTETTAQVVPKENAEQAKTVAKVDVVVENSKVTPEVKAKDKAKDVAKVEPAETEKPMTAAEKAKAKKKMDEEREKQIALSGNPVIIPVNTGGRLDPFVPYFQASSLTSQDKFELVAPPTIIPEVDPVIDELVNTKISGIMFDTTRPSAIVNFGGVDHLVHIGDLVKGFKIVNITKDSVVIRYQANVYQVSVGQSINDGLNINPVSGLSSSFGGAYSKTPQNVIQINN